jgi:L-alanine-DL-glutamate epimerase-like enolase superfamily enzyme
MPTSTLTWSAGPAGSRSPRERTCRCCWTSAGITELVKVFTAAALHNVTVMPHSFYGGPGLLAAIHATAALGTADSMIEWPHLDLEATILGDALTAKNSRVQVPQCPGLGIDPDPDVISTYQLKN